MLGEAKQERKQFFFEKKNQKTFAPGVETRTHLAAYSFFQELKVFWFFFSKRNCFLTSSVFEIDAMLMRMVDARQEWCNAKKRCALVCSIRDNKGDTMQKLFATLLALAAASPACAAKIDVSTKKSNITQWQASEVLNGMTYTLPAQSIGKTLYGGVPGLKFPFHLEHDVGRNDGFWYADLTFTLPDNATKPRLHLSALGVDDRAVVELNGRIVSDGGSGGPGHGYMTFTDGGSNKAYYFHHGVGPQHVATKNGFIAGANDLRLIVNNTGEGIQGKPIVKIKGNPTNVGILGYVSYQTQNDEPRTAALLMRSLR